MRKSFLCVNFNCKKKNYKQCIIILCFILIGLEITFAILPPDVKIEKIITPKEGLSNQYVLSVVANDDYIYVGTKYYLNVIKSDGSIIHLTPKNTALKFVEIPAMTLRENELWVTCRSPIAGGGTYRWNGVKWDWFEEIKDDMQSNYISCFHVDEKNTLWIGTQDQGVNYYNPDSNAFKRFGYLATKKGLISNNVTAITSRNGEIWIGTPSGISVYKGKKEDGGKEEYLFTNFTLSNGLPADHITALASSDKAVYAGTTRGLLIYDSNNNWKLLDKQSGLSDNWILCLALDKSSDELWVGTIKGLQRFKTGYFEPAISYTDGLPASQIRCLYVFTDKAGITRIFAGTDMGLVILKKIN